MTDRKKSFILFYDFYKPMKMLNMKQRGELISAIFEYQINGIIPSEMSYKASMAFEFIQPVLDRNTEAYEKKCEALSKNGKKGGRPKKEKIQESNCFFEKAKKADSDNDIDIDIESEIEIGIESGSDTEYDSELRLLTSGASGSSACSADSVTSKKQEKEYFEEQIDDMDELLPITEIPVMTQKEKNALMAKGLPSSYIERRWVRAAAYAESGRRTVGEVLCEWWKKDRENWHLPTKVGQGVRESVYTLTPEKDAEINDWFEKRLAMTGR